MSTNVDKPTAPVASTSSGEFSKCVPASVDSEKRMSGENVARCWNEIYKKAGLVAGGEDSKKALRCAVYLYWAINGTSPRGNYSGKIITGAGTVFTADVLTACVQKLNMRQFARGNAVESVKFFRKTTVLQDNEDIKAKCTEHNISWGDAMAVCDWLSEGDGMTVVEADAARKLKYHSLERANHARNGQSIQDEDDKAATRMNTVTSPAVQPAAADGRW